MKERTTAKLQTTVRVNDDFRKRDKRSWFLLKISLGRTGNDIRNIRKKLSKLDCIKSTDLNDLDKAIDNYDDFNKKIQGIVKDRLSPEWW